MQELTSNTFDSTAKGDMIIDFWAPWCGPCRMMAPVFESASRSHKYVTFAKVNTDEEQMLSQQFGIRGIPTIVFLRNGKEIGRHVGYADARTLEQKIHQTFT